MLSTRALARLTGSILVVCVALAACNANTGNHTNQPQRTICFGALECGSSMKCVKNPNQINGVCMQLSELEDGGATAAGDGGGPVVAPGEGGVSL